MSFETLNRFICTLFFSQVDFSVREMSLDFSRLRTAAGKLMGKKSGEMLALNSNNAILEFLLDGTPEVRPSRLYSRAEQTCRFNLLHR